MLKTKTKHWPCKSYPDYKLCLNFGSPCMLLLLSVGSEDGMVSMHEGAFKFKWGSLVYVRETLQLVLSLTAWEQLSLRQICLVLLLRSFCKWHIEQLAAEKWGLGSVGGGKFILCNSVVPIFFFFLKELSLNALILLRRPAAKDKTCILLIGGT